MTINVPLTYALSNYLASLLQRGDCMQAFWLVYGSLPLTAFDPALADRWILPLSWWEAAVRSKQFHILEDLWNHAPDDVRASIGVLSTLLNNILDTRQLDMYEWLVNKSNKYWFFNSIPKDGLNLRTLEHHKWRLVIREEGERGNKRWAQGYLNVFVNRINPRSRMAREAKEYWNQVRVWAGVPVIK